MAWEEGWHSGEDQEDYGEENEEQREPGQHASEGLAPASSAELPASHWSNSDRCKTATNYFPSQAFCHLEKVSILAIQV